MMLLLTNFRRFPERWTTSSGVTGRALMLTKASEFMRHSRDADFIIVNCDVNITLWLSVFFLLFPWRRRPILSHDIVLRKPLSLRRKITAPIKRFLLSRVDHFSLHFTNLYGYEKYFGIEPDRASYLPSKPNIRYRYQYRVTPDGEYILCFGRSERDYDTFFAAMEQLRDLPAAIPPPNFKQFRKHATRFSRPLNALPKNVRLLEDNGSVESLIQLIEGARLVVLPIIASRIAPSGIGTYLNAMLMGKCVITSHGVATTDVLTQGEALLVEAENPTALAQMIRLAWSDDALRLRTAGKGRLYSESCGGEPELRQRVLDRAISVLYPSRRPSRNPKQQPD
jgi:glycosyltransferase involved in cell wall biosynthesis